MSGKCNKSGWALSSCPRLRWCIKYRSPSHMPGKGIWSSGQSMPASVPLSHLTLCSTVKQGWDNLKLLWARPSRFYSDCSYPRVSCCELLEVPGVNCWGKGICMPGSTARPDSLNATFPRRARSISSSSITHSALVPNAAGLACNGIKSLNAICKGHTANLRQCHVRRTVTWCRQCQPGW